MRVLICGGRAYNDRQRVYDILDAFHAKTPISLMITGACEGRLDLKTGETLWGADRLGEQWAQHTYIPYLGIPAVWHVNGKLRRSAGYERNALLITKGRPQAAIAFPGGRGTANMVERLQAVGIPVDIIVASSAS